MDIRPPNRILPFLMPGFTTEYVPEDTIPDTAEYVEYLYRTRVGLVYIDVVYGRREHVEHQIAQLPAGPEWALEAFGPAAVATRAR